MIIKSIEIERFRSFHNVSFYLWKRLTAISGRNATQKTTVLGMLGQPFTISKDHHMFGEKTIDGFNFRSQFKEKFKISPLHDIIGEHKWKLNLYEGIHENNYYSVESIARRQGEREPTLRFWNSESRARGAGYIQIPVYYLSLSRLFPIGEVGKTQRILVDLTEEEQMYYTNNYRTILSIQSVQGTPTVGLETSSSRVFAGMNDDLHDVFTNSAGEGDISRIILAILSFKRLKEKFPQDYKGGILLIDEIDATLYGFSQKKLVNYLFNAAREFCIQIIFTTHSPIILEEVNKLQLQERKRKGIEIPPDAYDSSIVYLEPEYDDENRRFIVPKNVFSVFELNNILSDINLTVNHSKAKLNIYCEDKRATEFLEYVFSEYLHITPQQFMDFVDIDLGWTNYVQLVSKRIPEFLSNIIVLDNDVILELDKQPAKKECVENANNVIFLPLTIERDIFVLLKNPSIFRCFTEEYSRDSRFSFDICFNNWPLSDTDYKTNDFKNWYKQTVDILGNQQILFRFWCNKNEDLVRDFVREFVTKFNYYAEEQGFDSLPDNEP